MFRVRRCVAAYVVSYVLALMTNPLPVSAAEDQPKTRVLFTNVNVFDGKSDKLAEGMSVLVEGNLIKEIAKGDIDAREDATVIDGGGRKLMPGLIDSHVHFNALIEGGLDKIEAARWDRIGAVAAAAAREWFMDGFTTVRDMGGLGNGLKMTIDKGLLAGPRIYPSGSYVSQTSGHGDLLE